NTNVQDAFVGETIRTGTIFVDHLVAVEYGMFRKKKQPPIGKQTSGNQLSCIRTFDKVRVSCCESIAYLFALAVCPHFTKPDYVRRQLLDAYDDLLNCSV